MRMQVIVLTLLTLSPLFQSCTIFKRQPEQSSAVKEYLDYAKAATEALYPKSVYPKELSNMAMVVNPVEIDLGEGMSIGNTLMQVSVKNSFAFCDRADYKIAHMDHKGRVKIDMLCQGFLRNGYDRCDSDDTNDVLWATNGRGIYLYDISNKKKSHIIGSGDGNKSVDTIVVSNSSPRRVFVFVSGTEDIPIDYLAGFDYETEKKIIRTPNGYHGGVLKCEADRFIFSEWDSEGCKQLVYRETDNQFEMSNQNKLTKYLTKMNMQGATPIYCKYYSFEKKLMFGSIPGLPGYFGKPEEVYVLLRWDEGFENFRMTPLAPYLQKDARFTEYRKMNQSCEWVALRMDVEDLPLRWAFMRIGEYPGGLSPVIKGGYVSRPVLGVWVDHEQWGPCYVVPREDDPHKLDVYRMSDALVAMKEELAKMAGR